MDIQNLKFNAQGLIPAVAQDYETKEVLMLAYMNAEAIEKTISTRQAHYYSRSRQVLWLKGETSGHFQLVREIKYDCDADALLLLVEQTGAACHTGNKSCFYRDFETDEKTAPAEMSEDMLRIVYQVIEERVAHPKEGSYTNYLFDKGIDKMLKKVGEEAAEVIIAAKNNEKSEVIYEISDLCYHLSVVMVRCGVTWDDIYHQLKSRR